MRLAFLVGYLGTNFNGSQYQPATRTIEGEFIHAGIELGLFNDSDSAQFQISGRTDKGVSARHQIISINTEYPEKAIDALNFKLPKDIWCIGVSEVPDDFNPRHAVSTRTYRYYFPYSGNIQKMNEAVQVLVGRHDFTRFSKIEPGKDPYRTVTNATVFSGSDGLPIFEISAESFLWNMIRGISGCLALVGCDIVKPDTIQNLLIQPGDRVHPTSSDALILWDVKSDVEFKPMRQSTESMRILGNISMSSRIQKRVSEAILTENVDDLWKQQLIREYPTVYRDYNN
ncbi:MAG TPA: tRNA pseudouridine(38-40) synthase TruA [Methanocorpusculum sp.]|nr:tRNA pseudouridine(38-40) synthase TruA [Methanocorpusculum sp.]